MAFCLQRNSWIACLAERISSAWHAIRAIIAPLSRIRCPPNRSFVLPFRIYKVQNDGGLHFVEAMQTFDDAKERVRELGEIWPGEYVIDNEATGERLFVSTSDESKN